MTGQEKMMETTEIKKRIDEYFRPRNKEEGEDLNKYVRNLVKHMEQKIGFTKFHQHIQQVLKTFIGNPGIDNREDWANICMTITGNEGIWITAIGVYLNPEQIQENEDNSF